MSADDVTEEILEIAVSLTDGHYPGRIDWDDVWDRMDGAELADGAALDLGEDLGTPAMNKIQAHVRNLRRSS